MQMFLSRKLRKMVTQRGTAVKINATLFICCEQVYATGHTDGNALEFHSAVVSQFMQN